MRWKRVVEALKRLEDRPHLLAGIPAPIEHIDAAERTRRFLRRTRTRTSLPPYFPHWNQIEDICAARRGRRDRSVSASISLGLNARGLEMRPHVSPHRARHRRDRSRGAHRSAPRSSRAKSRTLLISRVRRELGAMIAGRSPAAPRRHALLREEVANMRIEVRASLVRGRRCDESSSAGQRTCRRTSAQ